MKRRIIEVGITLLLYGVLASPCFAQALEVEQNHEALCLERTEVRTIHSNIVGQDYQLVISLPTSYHLKDTVYPVIYLLDPYRAFSIVKGYTDVLTAPYNYIPEVIIVGIGYGGKGHQAMLNWLIGRTRDLTPVENQVTEERYKKWLTGMGGPNIDFQTGGAGQFLKFMEMELFPFVEYNYRADAEDRILFGYSFGGLFAMYTLFHHPELFSRYFIGSPSISYKDGITFRYEAEYAKNHSDLKATVFISAGEKEKLTSNHVRQMDSLLRSRNFKSLTLKAHVFEGEDHVTCIPAAIGRGVIDVFRKQEEQ